MNLNTIKDFDFGVGPSNDTVRVANVPDDVTKSEVNLILWLILEKELLELDVAALRNVRSIQQQRAAAEGGASGSDPDVVDSSHPLFGSPPELIPGLTARLRRRTVSHSGKARRYAEELLRRSGISLPFGQLSVSDRKDLFQQFSGSSELLKDKKFSSISELFDALRTKSKLKEEFIVEERLGGGNFGDVYAVIHRESNKKYAAKRVSLTVDGFEEIKMTLNESRILRNLKHNNIVQCTDAWLEMQYDPKDDKNEQEPLKFYLLMDFCYQSLSEWIIDFRKKPQAGEVLLILRQVLDGLKFLHSKQILHFDINTKNIMWIDSERTGVKICDFGLAIKGQSYPFKTGTEPYAAPDGIFTNKSDIYSLGVTMLEIAENICTMSELVQRISKKNFKTDFRFLKNILPLLLAPHPNNRPTAEELQVMLNRVLNPPHRPSLELDEEDYKLFYGSVPPPHAHASSQDKALEKESSNVEKEVKEDKSGESSSSTASATPATEQEKPTEEKKDTASSPTGKIDEEISDKKSDENQEKGETEDKGDNAEENTNDENN